MALYLYPVYHRLGAARPFWAQVGDHYFYVLYSFVATSILTLFAWDFFFPDSLDVQVIATLPLRPGKLLRARLTAILILLAGFLFDSNFLAPLVLPAATDPPHLGRLLLAHLAATLASGWFGAASMLGLQGALLALLGERLFRSVAVWIQGVSVTVLLTLLLLYPVFFGSLRSLVQSPEGIASYLPPLWFLGVYQRLLEGPGAASNFIQLAHIGGWATLLASSLAALAYPFAYLRKVRGLVEGVASRKTLRFARALDVGARCAFARSPAARAVWHFIGQTLLRVPRYRVYLMLYGGTGLALLFASVARLSFRQQQLHLVFSETGLRAVIPIVACWSIAGLRTTFLSPSEQQGSWVFRVIHGRPRIESLQAAPRWALSWGLLLCLAAIVLMQMLVPRPSHDWHAIAAQSIVALGLCLLLSDVLFLNVKVIPFTYKPPAHTTNLAVVVIQYCGFFPPILILSVDLQGWLENWLEKGVAAIAIAIATIAVTHFGMAAIQQRILAEHSSRGDLGEDEEEFPLRLGLRY